MSNDHVSAARSILSRAAKHLYSTTSGPQEPLDTLELIQRVEWMLDAAKDELVAGARKERVNWGQIGRATGMTRQGARQRWGLRCPESDEDRAWRRALSRTRPER